MSSQALSTSSGFAKLTTPSSFLHVNPRRANRKQVARSCFEVPVPSLSSPQMVMMTRHTQRAPVMILTLLLRRSNAGLDSQQTRYEAFLDEDGQLLNKFEMMWALRERFPLHFFVFKQVASHLAHEANVEQVFSRAGGLTDPHMAAINKKAYCSLVAAIKDKYYELYCGKGEASSSSSQREDDDAEAEAVDAEAD